MVGKVGFHEFWWRTHEKGKYKFDMNQLLVADHDMCEDLILGLIRETDSNDEHSRSRIPILIAVQIFLQLVTCSLESLIHLASSSNTPMRLASCM